MGIRFKVSYFVLAVLLWAWSAVSLSQTYNFIHLASEEGLPQSQVDAIAEDQFGNLWLGTFGGGLSKFDGLTFKSYSRKDGLLSNAVFDVEVDRHNRVWAVCRGGISIFDGAEFRNISLDSLGLGPAQFVKLYKTKDDQLWLYSLFGALYPLTDQFPLDFTAIPGTDTLQVSDITFMDSTLIVGSYQKGLFIYENDSWQLVDGSLDISPIRKLFCDRRGLLWIVGNNRVYFTNSGYLKEGQIFPTTVELNSVNAIREDLKGALWFGTERGAIRYADVTSSPIMSEQGLTNQRITDIYSDRSGTLWFATYGDGLFKFRSNNFKVFQKPSELSEGIVMTILKDEYDQTWFGSYGNGLFRYDGREVTKISTPFGDLAENIVCGLTASDGSLWFGTRGSGVLRKLGDRFDILTSRGDGLNSDIVFSLAEDSEGKIWIGTQNGVNIWDGERFENYSDSTQIENIWSLYSLDPRNMLISYEDRVISLDPTTKTLNFTINTQNPVFDITNNGKGELFLALYNGGVMRYNLITKNTQYINASQGFDARVVYSLVFDDMGDLVAGTNEGLQKIVFDDSSRVSKVISFGQSDGLGGRESNRNAIHKNTDGSIWVGTVGGPHLYNPRFDYENTVSPIVKITDLHLSFQEVDWSNYSDSVAPWTFLPAELELPHNQNHLTFDFIGNDLSNPDQVKYQYKLTPLDDQWSPIVKSREVTYPKLPAGTYTFEVKAINKYGFASTPAAFDFIIKRPFWRSPWFYLIFTFVIASTLFIYHRYRVNIKINRVLTLERAKAEEAERIRKEVAKDFHDEIGNHLASMNVLTDLISKRIENDQSDEFRMVNKLKGISQYLFSGARDFIWSIDPKHDAINELAFYVKDFAEDLFENSSIQFQCDLSSINNSVQHMPGGWSRQMILVAKEAFTNILKHSDANRATLGFEMNHEVLKMMIRDDGIGINGESVQSSRGVNNMKTRAERIGSILEIKSERGNGTLITLISKIPQNGG